MPPEPDESRAAESARPLVDRLRARFEAVFRGDDPRLLRLGRAETSVRFLIGERESVTVLLDRTPPVVAADGDASSEITIELSTEQGESLASGELSLPALLQAGRAGYRGPVRKYLMVDPVLRSMVREHSRGVEARRQSGRDIDAEVSARWSVDDEDFESVRDGSRGPGRGHSSKPESA